MDESLHIRSEDPLRYVIDSKSTLINIFITELINGMKKKATANSFNIESVIQNINYNLNKS